MSLIPTVPLSKSLFVFFNYLVVGLFIAMNVYITYQIVNSYGPVLFSLFRGERDVEVRSGRGIGIEVSDSTKSVFGLALMGIGVVLTITIVGMVWGIPLFMIGWDIRDRVSRKQDQQSGDETVTT